MEIDDKIHQENPSHNLKHPFENISRACGVNDLE